MTMFTPTAQWQDLPDDAELPGGCHITMDLATGRRRVRLMPELESEPDLEPDLDEAQRFLERLDPEAEWFAFQTFSDRKAGERDPYAKSFGGSLDTVSETVVPWNRDKSVGVFVTVNETRGHRRKAGDVNRIRAVIADLDGSPIEPVRSCPLEPHVVVESSPGKFHAYWLVDGLPLEQFKPVQKAIAARFGGDPAVCDLPRVMRVPGFLHQKGKPFRTRIIEDMARAPYNAEEILAEFPPVARRTNGAGASMDFGEGDPDYIPDDELVRGIISGERFHEATRNLAARYARRGMRRRDVLETLRGHMNASNNPRDDRWQARSMISSGWSTARSIGRSRSTPRGASRRRRGGARRRSQCRSPTLSTRCQPSSPTRPESTTSTANSRSS